MHRLLAIGASALLFCAMPPAVAQSQDLPARLEALAARGNGEAAYHLGMIYHMGLNGVTRDPRRALELFRASAAAGDPLGAYKLGCYYDGQGEGLVEPDAEQALRYKLVAAEAGYALAQLDVARHYINRGDVEQALRWLNAAAHQGDLMSLAALAAYYSGQIPGETAAADRARQYAFSMLMIRQMTRDPDPRLDRAEMEAGLRSELRLSAAELQRAQAIIDSWRIERSPVTLRADLGAQAAEALVGRAGV